MLTLSSWGRRICRESALRVGGACNCLRRTAGSCILRRKTESCKEARRLWSLRSGRSAQGFGPLFMTYFFVGRPWKTQKRIRQLMNVWFEDDPIGICGDEAGGAISSWYVFSAMGFYPVAPGKRFVIITNNVSQKDKYIQQATLNGKPLSCPWFEHKDISSGGMLVLEMGPRPNKKWSASPVDAPPSMSDERLSSVEGDSQ